MEQLKTLGFGFGGILLLLAIWVFVSDFKLSMTPLGIFIGFAFVCILLGRITTILEQKGGPTSGGVPYKK